MYINKNYTQFFYRNRFVKNESFENGNHEGNPAFKGGQLTER